MKPKFGDILRNNWTSEKNPYHKGIYVRAKTKNWEMTDGKGVFWETSIRDNRMEIIGTVISDEIDGL